MPNNVEASPIFSTFALRSLKSEAGLFLSLFSGEKFMPNNVEASPIFSTFALRSLKSEAGLFLSLFSGEK
jgi:hypothetical protein